MRMHKLFLMAGMLVSLLVTGCGGGGENLPADKPANTGKAPAKIVVGLDDEYPPMGFKDESNQIIGFDVDLAKETAKRLGSEVEFKAIDWSSKEAELKSGRIDVLWNGLDITPERQENMLFSDPYMDNRQIIFVRTGDTQGIAAETDLAGKAVGTQAGSTAETYITSKADLRNSFKEFKTYGDYISAFMDLENGRIDAVVCDEIVGRYYISKHPEGLQAINNVTVGPVSEFGIAFAKENTALKDQVQNAFNEVIKDGTATKISNQWFGADLIKAVNVER